MAPKWKFEIVVLQGAEFLKQYKRAWNKVIYTKSFTKAMHQAEFYRFDDALRKALSRYWEEDCCGQKDFAIMHKGEWSGKWHHCGGIYSNRICCGRYVSTIINVVRGLPHGPLWTYHTAVENADDEPVLDGTEFFVRDSRLFILPPLDGESYERIFHGKA
jgi:hypothetical protein